MSWIKRILILATLLSCLATLIYAILLSTGYFDASSVAQRELRAQGLTAGSSALQLAIERDDPRLIHLLARAGVSIDAIDASLESPLQLALSQQRWKAAHTLIDLKHEVTWTGTGKFTPLQIALGHRQMDLADRLLREGADPNVRYAVDQPALIEAIRRQQTDTFRLLLAHGANPNLANATGATPLYLTLRSGQSELASLLLQKGADANGTTPSGQPLLHFMISHYADCGYTEKAALAVINLMIQSGVDLKRADATGKRPLALALETSFSSAVELLLRRIDKVESGLWTVLERGDFELAQTLLEKGADVNERREDGETPLNLMVKAKRPDLVHHFLNHGANPTLPGKEGQSAVPLAIVLGDQRTTLTLLGHEYAPPPDEHLAHPVSSEFVKLFSSALLAYYLRNAQQITPLMCAVCLDQEAVVLKLIERGARRYATTAPRKVYPVQLAAKRENVRMQQILLGVPYEDDQQERKFVINLAKQTVTLSKKGEVVKTAKISSGRKSHPTEPGHYVITEKIKMHHSNIYDDAEMPFFQRFSCTAMGFHQGALPGYPASHGCIRLAKSTAEYFFEESKIGDWVIIREK